MVNQATVQDKTVQLCQEFLRKLLGSYQSNSFAIRFWDGSTWLPNPGSPAAYTLVLQHPGALRKMFWPPNDLALGEAYVHNDFDLEGDIIKFFGLLEHVSGTNRSLAEKLELGTILAQLPSRHPTPAGQQPAEPSGSRHSRERDRQAVSYHYDLSNDFFALWLDARMVYSCAYFADPGDSLETAQLRKLDYICRKLRLRPGDRLLDIGCGWGGLILHAARHYGVEATGITLAQRQLELASERIRAAGLEGRCRVLARDYRDLDGSAGYDKIASVGMVEHLGEGLLPAYFQAAWRLLRPGGVFLNHGITLRDRTGFIRWGQFAQRYVFPDGELWPVSTGLREAEAAGFEVRDVENLREHYALTLRHWLKRLEARHEDACRVTSDATYRVFRLYLAGAVHRFETCVYNLHQALLSKPDQGKSGLPLTRTDWYAGQDRPLPE